MALRGITPFERTNAAMDQLVERVLGKDEVTGSIPVSSSKLDRVEPGEIGSSRSFFCLKFKYKTLNYT